VPWDFASDQWLQSVRLFPNGSGAALIHSEFHGEDIGNVSLCSFTHTTAESRCQYWSTGLGVTVNGGETWQMAGSLPSQVTFVEPRRYVKDEPLSGYGAVGGMVEADGYTYGHVNAIHAGASASAPNSTGVCAFRTDDVFDPRAFRGWNGTAWATTWVDPYTTDPSTLDLGHSCAVVDTGFAGNGHPSVRTFAGDWRPMDWPTHVMTGWPEGKPNHVAYAYPAWRPGSPAAFTAWDAAQYLDVTGWLPPSLTSTCAATMSLMYPSLLDVDAPFALGNGTSAGLSYSLVGNASAYLYFVLGRKHIVRLPVAFVPQDTPTPLPPFPPGGRPLNPPGCTAFNVTGAGTAGVDGLYVRTGKVSAGQTIFQRDGTHQLYCYGSPACSWRLADEGVRSYYQSRPTGNASVPVDDWCDGTSPGPKVSCVAATAAVESPRP